MDSLKRNLTRSANTLRVLMQTRSNALTQRGGDTVVMERVAAGIRQMGHHVDVDVEGRFQPREYDLVHLFNFCTPEITEAQARRCVEQKVPFVVTTMYEDWPLFFNRMAALYTVLERYVQVGQPIHLWDQIIRAIDDIPAAEIQRNDYTAAHAGALIPTGKAERDALLRDYPNTKKVEIYHCGCDVGPFRDDGELFRSRYGISDFVLCVGRLEWRKNQLMLLKALEESELPIVFLDGGFSYQPPYVEVMKAFKRRGPTHYIGRVSPEELASAFAASRVHVLPSWYELPGLVNIEAAHYGTNIVVTEYGTIRDYLGDDARYCKPDDASSILRAVEEAYHAPRNTRLQERVKQFTWESAARRNFEIYEGVLQRDNNARFSTSVGLMSSNDSALTKAALEQASQQVQSAGIALDTLRGDSPISRTAETISDEGDRAARQMLVKEAEALYREALQVDPRYLRARRGLGVLALATKQYKQAEQEFRLSLEFDDSDCASLSGLGAAVYNQGHREEGVSLYLQALAIRPDHHSSLAYLTSACYDLDRLDVLEEALTAAGEIDDTNNDLQFCLAGCLFKRGKKRMSKMVLEQILDRDPGHLASLELYDVINNPAATTEPQVAERASQPAPVELKLSERSAGEIAQLEELHRKRSYEQVAERANTLAADSALNELERSTFELLRGEALACLNELGQAGEIFTRLESSPTVSHRALSGQAVVAAAKEDWTLAETLFQKALEKRPNHDVSLAGMGMCRTREGKLQEGWDFYTKALAENPENMRAILGLLQVGYPLKKLSQVESALNRYLEFNPGNLSILYAHAGCCYAQGKSEEAVLQLEKIRIFEPTHELANELLAKIESDIPNRLPQ